VGVALPGRRRDRRRGEPTAGGGRRWLQSGHRLPTLAALPSRRLGCASGPAVDAAPPATAAVGRGGGADRARAPAHGLRARPPGRARAAPALNDRQGAAPARLLAPAATRRECRPLRAPLRARAPGRAPACGHKAAWPLLGARQARARRRGRAAAPQPQDRLAALACCDRRPLAPRLRRAPRRSRRRQLRLLPRAGGRLVCRAGHRRRTRADRQREGVPRARLDRAGAPPRHRAPLHTHLPAADERQGRALHPDAAHRVGLRAQLSLERRPSSSARRLPALVQQTPPAQLATSAAADQPRLTPLWSRQ
jgi:hypothetical protein